MIAWFARNSVAANLLMGTIIVVGLYSVFGRLVLEVFPEFESDVVQISVSYRGATPSEVERSVLVRIEEAIQDLQGIEELRASASEGSGQVSVEVAKGHDPRALMDDLKNRVDAISTFPQDVERPTYAIAIRRREVIGVVVSGEIDEARLRRLGEQVRDDLTRLPSVTQVELTEVRPFEISIELSEATLREYGLTFDAVAAAVKRSSLDLPAGTIKSRAGEIRVRTLGQKYVGADFEKLVVLRRNDGSQVSLGELGKVRDGFEESPIEARFNGVSCVVLEVYRVGKQDAIELARQVKQYVAAPKVSLPPGVSITQWRDRSVIIEKRLDTLISSALQGGFLVLLVLGLFLRPTLAAWVCVGIPVSFLGALAVMPSVGITINVMSLFSFILVLGIVVDDAIVTGENIYTHLRRGDDPTEAVIRGTEEVSLPVTFGILTTMAAFIPVLMMGGRRGPIFAQIPYIVVPVLFFSLVESKLVLPAHLKHFKLEQPGAERGRLARFQTWVADGLERFAVGVYQPALRRVLDRRVLASSIAIAALLIIGAAVGAGHIRFQFFPRIQSETARASLQMPSGTSFAVTRGYVERMTTAAKDLQRELIDPATGESIIIDILSTSGSAGSTQGQSNIGRVSFVMVPPEDRTLPITSGQLIKAWRKKIGPLPGAREVTFRAEIGRGGSPIEVQLAGRDLEELKRVADGVKQHLREYPGVFDITDSFQEGPVELRLRLKPSAELLGLSVSDLATQVRQGFFGDEAQRIQRGRDDVRIMIRYQRDQRTSLAHIQAMQIRTAGGVSVPFSEVAEVELERGFATINRIDRRRTITVEADVDKENVPLGPIYAQLRPLLEELTKKHRGVSFAFKGEAEEQNESFAGLAIGLGFVLAIIYLLLAIPFRSYTQPLIVMCVIPFGWAGAVLGHVVMGFDLSIFSLLGMLALTGVVVNDSLVMVDFVNRRRAEDEGSLLDAVRTAGVARFRAIILTSLTTFAGLVPLVFFEKSTQAQFLIPMAVSLGFGVLFSTSVTLFLVPVGYLLLEDVKAGAVALKAVAWDLEPHDAVPPVVDAPVPPPIDDAPDPDRSPDDPEPPGAPPTP